jgi:hypothetical protein
MKALTKSSARWSELTSVVYCDALISTERALVFMRIISLQCSTTGFTICSQDSLSGV